MTQISNEEYFVHLKNNLDFLFENGKIGLAKFHSVDVRVKPNKYTEMIQGYKNYHLIVDIPYAARILTWDVIFDPEDFSELPDFDFNDQYFLPEPDINYVAEMVPSWDQWDLTEPHSLLNILNEFLSLYKKAQMEKLLKDKKFALIKKQYEDLMEIVKLSVHNIEVHIETIQGNDLLDKDEYILINFLINLPVNFEKLPEYCQEDNEKLLNPGNNFVHLHVQMKKLDNSQNKISLTLSPRVEQVLGTLKLPKFHKDDTLSSYALAIQGIIEEQIALICEQHNARKLFVVSVLDSLSSSIIEYDATNFYKVSFIYEDLEDYDCLVTLQLGGKFPQERPKLQLNSLYCQNGKTCNKPVVFQTYNPQETPEENLKALNSLLKENIKVFQHHQH